MNILESVRVALSSLGSNKLRAGLTMLGVIIGVAAVVVLVSVGRGMQTLVTGQLQGIGTNLLTVEPGATQQGGIRSAMGSVATLTMEDGKALEFVTGVLGVSPEVRSFAQVVYEGENANARVSGVTPSFETVHNSHASAGEFISAANVAEYSLVACLGSAVAENLFPDQDPLGQTVRINNIPFEVTCVMESKGGSGFLNQDNQVLVPLTSAQMRLARGQDFRGSTSVDQLALLLTDTSIAPEVKTQITEILRERHSVQDDDFTIESMQDMLNMANTVFAALTVFLGSVAAISLIVGGIGIMNIMLVSVTERTREIGIRKAVGARRRDVLTQFLTEAAALSVLGGLIGLGIAWSLALLVGATPLADTLGKPRVDLDIVVLAVSFSAGIGLFFGIYPAWRASALHPIDALRYE